jgi:hypothetical protein
MITFNMSPAVITLNIIVLTFSTQVAGYTAKVDNDVIGQININQP